MKRRILSAVTAVLLLVSLLPVTALAEEAIKPVDAYRIYTNSTDGINPMVTEGKVTFIVEEAEFDIWFPSGASSNNSTAMARVMVPEGAAYAMIDSAKVADFEDGFLVFDL